MKRQRVRHRGDRDLVVAGVLLLGLAVWSTWRVTSGWGWTLAVLGTGAWVLALGATVLRRIDEVRWRVADAAESAMAMAQIRPLLGALPVPLGAWAMDPAFGARLVELLVAHRPRMVLECGSGSSTVLVAETLRHLGQGRVLSVDHLERWAGETRRMLEQRDLGRIATVLALPLTRQVAEGKSIEWYADGYLPHLDAPIDLLIVDGPPGKGAPLARWPALPLLLPHLASRCVIVMDDGDRPDEARIAGLWAERLGVTAQYLPGGKGTWVLTR